MSKDISARQIMRTELVTLSPSIPALDAIFSLIQGNISGAPVVGERGKYLGVFSEKCSFQAMANMVDGVAESHHHIPRVHEFMNRRVICLPPDMPVFDAIDYLLQHRISGAPVVDSATRYLGIFSEKTAMQVVVNAIYENVPGSEVHRYMNIDRNRLIDREADLRQASQIFLQTPYRRLPVLLGDKLEGQVSRRDVLRAEYQVTSAAVDKIIATHSDQGQKEPFKSKTVEHFMDTYALTKHPETDLLALAEAFLNSPYRRIPIVQDNQLVGQISRRDLLAEAIKLLSPTKQRESVKPLYLSSVTETIPHGLQ